MTEARDISSLRNEQASRVAEPPARWKTRVLLPGGILLVMVVLLAVTSAQALLPRTAVRVVPVVVKSVEGTSGTVTVQAPGWLEPDPHPYFVPALADGVVEEMLVLEGDAVEAGQVVARLVDDDALLALRRAEAALLEQQSRLRAAEANVRAAEQDLEYLVDRTRDVEAGRALLAEARAGLTQVEADIAVEQARLKEVEDEYQRKQTLTASQAVSEASVARLLLRVEAQRASVDAARARRDVVEAKLDQARAVLSAAEQHSSLLIEEKQTLALAEAALGTATAAVQMTETARDEAALRLSRMTVRSPTPGIVMRRLTSPGSKVMRDGSTEHSAHIVHIYDPQKLQVRVDVPLADASYVSVGQEAEIAVEVLPDRVFAGKVTRVVHEADIQKNTVEVKVAVEAPSADLTPEMLARVRFIGMQAADENQPSRQRVFAPAGLVGQDESGESVVVVVVALVDDKGYAEVRTVQAGARKMDGWIEIDRGLQPGDLLIADPRSGVADGERVRVVGEAVGGSL